MPVEELEKAGYTRHTLVKYTRGGVYEYYTFSDWTTVELGDTVTFRVKDGKVVDSIKEQEPVKKLDREI